MELQTKQSASNIYVSQSTEQDQIYYNPVKQLMPKRSNLGFRSGTEARTNTEASQIQQRSPASSSQGASRTRSGRKSPGIAGRRMVQQSSPLSRSFVSKKDSIFKNSKPSVIEPQRDHQRLMALARENGLEIHPRQQEEMLSAKEVQQMLLQKHNTDAILQRASAIQASILNTKNAYNSQQNSAQLNQGFHSLIKSENFENELKESIAQRIAIDLADNIHSNYQNLPLDLTNVHSDFEASSSKQAESASSPASRKSQGPKKKTSKKKKQAHLSKGTFSSNMKSLSPDQLVKAQELLRSQERQAERQSMQETIATAESHRKAGLSKSLLGKKTGKTNQGMTNQKPSKTLREVAASFLLEDGEEQKTNTIKNSYLFNLQKTSKPQEDQLRSGANYSFVSSSSKANPYVANLTSNHQRSSGHITIASALEGRRKSRSELRNSQSAALASAARREAVGSTEELVNQLSYRINDQAQQLAEQMKLINIADLYQLTGNNNEEIVSSLLQHQREQEEAKVSPGAAPTVNRFVNQFLPPRELSNGNRAQFQHSGAFGGIDTFTIPEMTEEEVLNNNSTPESKHFPASSSMQSSVKDSRPISSKQKKKKQSPMRNFLERSSTQVNVKLDHALKDQRIEQGVGRLNLGKKVYNSNKFKQSGSPTGSNIASNRYLNSLNKKYVDNSRSSSRLESSRLSTVRGKKSPETAFNPNQLDSSRINTIDEFEAIERSVNSKNPAKDPRSFQLVSEVKPRKVSAAANPSKAKPGKVSKQTLQTADKKQAEQDNNNSFFSRKNSSPSPFRLKGLQLKYNVSAGKQDEPITEVMIKNGPAEINQLQAWVEENSIEEVFEQAKGNTTERRNPKVAQIDLQTASEREDDSQKSDLRQSRERRSRKERSRDNRLSNNRPLSQNIESFSNSKKSIAVYKSLKKNEKTQQDHEYGEDVSDTQPLPAEQKSAVEARNTFQRLIQDRMSQKSKSNNEELMGTSAHFAGTESGASSECAYVEAAEVRQSAKPRYGETVPASPEKSIFKSKDHKAVSPQPKMTKIQQIFGASKFAPNSQLMMNLQQQEKSSQKAKKTKSFVSPATKPFQTKSKQSSSFLKKTPQTEITKAESKQTSKSFLYSGSGSNMKNRYIDNKNSKLSELTTPLFSEKTRPKEEAARVVARSTPVSPLLKPDDETGKSSQLQASHQKLLGTKKKTKAPKQNSGSKESELGLEIQPQSSWNEAQPTGDTNLNLPNNIFEHRNETRGLQSVDDLQSKSLEGPITQKLVANKHKRLIAKTKGDLKKVRQELGEVLKQMSIINLRELDAIRKPQRYMYFCTSLFKLLFEFVYKVDKVINSSSKAKKSMQANINKDLIDEFGREDTVVLEETDHLDNHMARRLQHKFFIQAEAELRRISSVLPVDQSKKSSDKEILEDWTSKIKPFLGNSSLHFLTQIQKINKMLKNLVDFNSEDLTDLSQIEEFSSKMLAFYEGHALLAQSCSKLSGTSSNLFGKLISIIHLSLVLVKKSCSIKIATIKQTQTSYATEKKETEGDESQSKSSQSQYFEGSQSNRSSNPENLDNKDNELRHVPVMQQTTYGGEVVYSDNLIDIQLEQSERRNTVQTKRDEVLARPSALEHQHLRSSSPLDGLLQMRQEIRQGVAISNVFEYQPSLSMVAQPTQAPPEFRIQLIQVEEDSQFSELEIASRGSTRSCRPTREGILVLEKVEETQVTPRAQVQGDISDESQNVEFHIENVGPSDRKTMKSIFNLKPEDYEEIETSNNKGSEGNPFSAVSDIGKEEPIMIMKKLNEDLEMNGTQDENVEEEDHQSNNPPDEINESIQMMRTKSILGTQGNDQEYEDIQAESLIAPEEEAPLPIIKQPNPTPDNNYFTTNSIASQPVRPNTNLSEQDDVAAIISRLNRKVNAISVPMPALHGRRKSQNPYLSGSAEHSRGPSEVQSLKSENSQNLKTPVKAKKKPENRLPIQYGLYNPRTGIPVYSIDQDFDDEDAFRIRPNKIFARNSASANKTAGGRGSPIIAAQPNAKNSSSRRSKASRQTQDSTRLGSGSNNQLNVVRQKLSTNQIVRKKTTKKEELKQSEMIPFPIAQGAGAQDVSMLDQAFNRVGDTTNPYSNASRQRDNSGEAERKGVEKLRQSIEDRRRQRSKDNSDNEQQI